jgi:hypothetical protein
VNKSRINHEVEDVLLISEIFGKGTFENVDLIGKVKRAILWAGPEAGTVSEIRVHLGINGTLVCHLDY